MPIPEHVKPRLSVSQSVVSTAVEEDPTMDNATVTEVNTALTSIDQEVMYANARKAWTTVVWDRVSPINGVPAQHFLDRDDVDENGTDDIYLLVSNGKVVGFQPHDPDMEGLIRIPKGQGKVRGDKHADIIAADAVASDVIELAKEKIKTNRDTV